MDMFISWSQLLSANSDSLSQCFEIFLYEFH